MKKITGFLVSIIIGLCVFLLSFSQASAQDLNDTLPESAYSMKVPKHVVNIYSNFVPYVLFGIIFLAMVYISYRYWSDNRPRRNDFTNHHLEH